MPEVWQTSPVLSRPRRAMLSTLKTLDDIRLHWRCIGVLAVAFLCRCCSRGSESTWNGFLAQHGCGMTVSTCWDDFILQVEITYWWNIVVALLTISWVRACLDGNSLPSGLCIWRKTCRRQILPHKFCVSVSLSSRVRRPHGWVQTCRHACALPAVALSHDLQTTILMSILSGAFADKLQGIRSWETSIDKFNAYLLVRRSNPTRRCHVDRGLVVYRRDIC